MPANKKDTWSTRAQKGRVSEEKNQKPYRGAFFSTVVSAAADEQVVVDSFVGRKQISYAYPFASANAWIRGQPEKTTTMLSIIGGDSGDLTPISYFDKQKSTSARVYSNVAGTVRDNPAAPIPDILSYRPIEPGELDMGHKVAQTFMGLTDVWSARGGLSHFTMTSASAEVETPLFHVKGATHVAAQQLTDEVRFGVVRRATPDRNTTFPALVRGPGISLRGPSAPFAKEATMVLTWQGLPSTLIDHRQGIVVEDDGRLATSSFTGQPLRARLQWKGIGAQTAVEIDAVGNWSLDTAASATTGGRIDIPAGSFLLTAGQQLTLRSLRQMELSTQAQLNASAVMGFNVTTPAQGVVRGNTSMSMQSSGPVMLESPIPSGIQLGSRGAIKHPVLVGSPSYLSTLSATWSAQAGADSAAANYAQAAVQAWAAVGPVLMLLDPSGTVAGLCLQAAASAGALLGASTAASTAIGTHMPTLSPAPTGFVSTKTISE